LPTRRQTCYSNQPRPTAGQRPGSAFPKTIPSAVGAAQDRSRSESAESWHGRGARPPWPRKLSGAPRATLFSVARRVSVIQTPGVPIRCLGTLKHLRQFRAEPRSARSLPEISNPGLNFAETLGNPVWFVSVSSAREPVRLSLRTPRLCASSSFSRLCLRKLDQNPVNPVNPVCSIPINAFACFAHFTP
jgi:hypothetical protein